jgi:hypothetical protein
MNEEKIQNPNTEPNPKQTATTETNQKIRIQDNRNLLSLKAGIRPSYLSPAKLRIRNIML